MKDPGPQTEKGEYSDLVPGETTAWSRDEENDVEGSYVPVEGTEQTTVTTETQDVVTDPLAGSKDVKLEMTAPTGNTPTTDTEKVTLAGDKALRDIIPKEGTQEDGSTVTYNYENGKLVGYTVTRYSPGAAAADNEENPIVEGSTTDTRMVSEKEDVYVLPQGYTEGTKTSTTQGRDGQTTIETTTDTKALEDGTGYLITTTQVVTTPYEGEMEDVTNEAPADFVNPPVIPEDAVWQNDNSYIQLPKKPEPSTVTDDAGETTEITVEEIRDSVTDVVIGYKTTTRITNPDGTLKSRSSVSEYGTITTFTSTTARDPDTQQVTTVTESTVRGLQDTQNYISVTSGTKDYNTTRLGQEDVYQLVETEGGLVFLYNGKMYAVEGTSTLKASTEVATGDTVKTGTFVTGSSDSDLRLYGEYLPNNSPGTVIDYYTGQLFASKYHDTKEDKTWTHIGYGLFSDFALKEVNGNSHSAKQFMIQDGDEIRYVYCVELGAGIAAGSSYGSTEYIDTTSGNAAHPWTGAEGTIGQIRSVALNGFWGTANGLGSLEAVKDLMRRNGLSTQADALTAGMALTATQVAIWEFGAKDGGKFGGDGYNFVTWDDGRGAAPDEATWKTIVALRDLLVDLAKNPQKGQAEVIDAGDVTGGAITLKEKATDSSGTAKQENGRDVYNTDLSFTLDVSTSSINGNLIVKVLVDGEEVGKARLAGEGDNSLFKWGKIYPDANGTYTIKDVELAEGVKVDLNLSGTQHLDDGVYVFKGEGNMQDFVGLSKLEQEVDLTISMEFDVTEPDLPLKHTRKTWSEKKTDKEAYVRTNNFSSTRDGKETDTKVTVTTKLYGTTEQTDVITQVTTTHRDWETYYSYTKTDDDGGDGEKKDKDVDPADAPKTGDATALLALVSLFSAGGLVLLNRKKEENEA